MDPLVTEAIVLHAFDYLETSRIIRLMTREAGVQSVLARGARSSKKRFGSAVDLFAQGLVEIYIRPNRDLQSLTSFDVTRSRPQLATDVGRFTAGSMIAELSLRWASDEEAPGLFDAVELAPFRAAAVAGIESMMTAHVVVSKIDPEVPATLSRAICTELLRGELGFRGVLICDDLEMKAVADRFPIEESAVRAITAGCDLLLVCSDEDLQTRAHEALVRRAEKDAVFRARCEEAFARSLALRRRFPPRPSPSSVASVIGGEASLAMARELASKCAT